MASSTRFLSASDDADSENDSPVSLGGIWRLVKALKEINGMRLRVHCGVSQYWQQADLERKHQIHHLQGL